MLFIDIKDSVLCKQTKKKKEKESNQGMTLLIFFCLVILV